MLEQDELEQLGSANVVFRICAHVFRYQHRFELFPKQCEHHCRWKLISRMPALLAQENCQGENMPPRHRLSH